MEGSESDVQVPPSCPPHEPQGQPPPLVARPGDRVTGRQDPPVNGRVHQSVGPCSGSGLQAGAADRQSLWPNT